MSTSLCIPTHKVTSEIINTINYFFLDCKPGDEVVLVIDGGIYDPILDAFKFPDGFFRAIVLKESHGPAFARNTAAKEAKGQKLIFIDSDVVAHPPVLKKLSEVEKRTALVPAVLPLGFWTRSSNFFSDFALAPKLFDGFTLAVSACFSIHREDFLAVKGFDENFKFPAGEDWDFFKRVQENGTALEFDSDLHVFHRNPRTPFGIVRRSYRYARYGSAIHDTSSSIEQSGAEHLAASNAVWFFVPQILFLGALKITLSSISIGEDYFQRASARIQKWQERQHSFIHSVAYAKPHRLTRFTLLAGKVVRLADAMRGFSIASPWESVVSIRKEIDDKQRKKYRFLVFLWRTAYILGYMSRKP